MEYNNYLCHHGIKGMKWGVRRYQNKDGSLTAAGKKRMYREQFDLEGADKKTRNKYYTDANKWVKEDTERTKRLVDESSQLTNKLKNMNDTSIRNKPKSRMDLSKMSDKEMRDQINRELLERQYNDVFNPVKVSKGRETAGKALEVAGNVLAVGSSALAIALAIKELRG